MEKFIHNLKTINFKKNFIFLIIISLFLSSCANNDKDENGINKNIRVKRSFFRTTREIQIYFLKPKSPEEIVFVKTKRRTSEEGSILEFALRELLLGPTEEEEKKDIRTEIPVGTSLLSLQESDTDVIVDLSSQYLTGGGSASVQLRYLQLYRTIENIAPGKKIFLNIDGKPPKTIAGEGLEVNQPLKRINDYTKKYEKIDSIPP